MTARTEKAPTTGDPCVDLLDAGFNNPTTPPPPPPMPANTLTENSSPTFASSGDPCLDFFFHVVPGTPAKTVASLLAEAWAAEPLTALRLACNLRGVRGTGKSDREGFYAAALWMHARHPHTLALNARAVAEFGYLKDLPELLHRIIHGGTRPPRRHFAGFFYRRRITSRYAMVERSDAERAPEVSQEQEEHERKIKAEIAMRRRKRHAEAALRALDRVRSTCSLTPR
jgi:hypothetical protein